MDKNAVICYIKNILTQKDNETFSMSKLAALSGTIALIYEFINLHSVDFQGFGIGISTILAALVAKYHVEGQKND